MGLSTINRLVALLFSGAMIAIGIRICWKIQPILSTVHDLDGAQGILLTTASVLTLGLLLHIIGDAITDLCTSSILLFKPKLDYSAAASIRECFFGYLFLCNRKTRNSQALIQDAWVAIATDQCNFKDQLGKDPHGAVLTVFMRYSRSTQLERWARIIALYRICKSVSLSFAFISSALIWFPMNGGLFPDSYSSTVALAFFLVAGLLGRFSIINRNLADRYIARSAILTSSGRFPEHQSHSHSLNLSQYREPK